ncbi:MAG: hypothetical protein O3A21_03240 [Proteobacteria bacterium]|nr:hypothetical protein [Pseudomonadota bacterium]
MTSSTDAEVMDCIFEHCGVDEAQIERQTLHGVNLMVGHMHGAAWRWQKPREIESQLENARTKLKEAMEAVQGLENYAKSMARLEADRGREEKFLKRIAEVARANLPNEEALERMKAICKEWQPQPRDAWVDIAALDAMKKLRAALTYPIEKAIANAPVGPGRQRNTRAYAVCEIAYQIFVDITGEKPTFWNGGETPFSRMLSNLYRLYGIRSTLRKPFEAAMHKFENRA